MTQHILAKGLSTIEDKGSELGAQAEVKFAEFDTAIANGNRTAQEAIASELRTIVTTLSNLVTAAHDHAKALMPVASAEKPTTVDVNASVAAKKR